MKTPISVIITEHDCLVDKQVAEHLKAIDLLLSNQDNSDAIVVDQLVELQVAINGNQVLSNFKEFKLWINSYIDMLVVSLGGRNAA